MKNKFILVLFFMVLLISPFVFSNETKCLTVDDVGKTFNHEDKICVCVLSEENYIDEYCKYNVQDNEKPELISTDDDLNLKNIDCNNTNLAEVNNKITELKNKSSELVLLSRKLIENKSMLEKYLKEYVVCKENSNGLKPNITTGNFFLNENLDSYNELDDNDELDDDDDELEISEDDLINDSLIESVNNLVRTSESIVGTNPNNACVEQKSKIIKVKNEIKSIIVKVREQKDLHKENLYEIKNLIKERELILKQCNRPVPAFNCKEDILKLENHKFDLFSKLQEAKEKLNQVDVNSNYYIELKKKYSRFNDEYMGVEQKIKILSKNCNNKDEFSIDPNFLENCSEKQDALENIASLKKELNDTNNIDKIYVLKTKLDFLQNKYDAISCNVSENDVEVVDCIKSLNVSSDLSADEVSNICKNGKNVEYQKRLTYMNKLNKEIKVKEQKLNVLNNKISAIEEKLRTQENKEEKLKLITENKTEILDDTTLKLENRINQLKKVVENIDLSNMKQEVKDIQINSLNERIASLERIKDNLLQVSDVSEFKDVLNNARKNDVLSKKIKNNTILVSQINSLDTKVLDKYFLDNVDYTLLKDQLNDIKVKVLAMDVNSENFDLVKEELELFKNNLKKYYAGGNNQ